MTIRIKSQRDYLLTEANVELPCDLVEVHKLMQEAGASGRVVAQYSEGGLLGVHLEQKSHIREGVADQVRKLTGVTSKEINGHYKAGTRG
jgi:hypothetical protein